MKDGIWNAKPVVFIREYVELVLEKRLFTSAGALAYFLILSVFPMLICVNGLISVLDLDLQSLLQAAAPFLPEAGLVLLDDYVDYISGNPSPGLFWAGLVGVFFSASAAFRQLLAVVDDLYGHRRFRGVRRWAVSVACSALLLVTVYCSVFVLFTGGWFLHTVAGLFPGRPMPWSWTWLRFPVLFCFLLAFVLVVYRLAALPDRRLNTKVRPPLFFGAVPATLALVIASVFFSLFFERSSRYSLVYGSLASVIILFAWLYLCGCILVLGAAFNCVLYRRNSLGRHK